MEDRLLTLQEVAKIIKKTTLGELDKELRKAQDTKSYTQALKDVGELLEWNFNHNYETVGVKDQGFAKVLHPQTLKVVIESLKQGKMPEEEK